jgi:hypothetical protein
MGLPFNDRENNQENRQGGVYFNACCPAYFLVLLSSI